MKTGTLPRLGELLREMAKADADGGDTQGFRQRECRVACLSWEVSSRRGGTGAPTTSTRSIVSATHELYWPARVRTQWRPSRPPPPPLPHLQSVLPHCRQQLVQMSEFHQNTSQVPCLR